jgi:hypothetical protein
MLRATQEVLIILFILACLTIPVAATADLLAWILRRPQLGSGFWVSLLGGTTFLFVLLGYLTLVGALIVDTAP